MLRNHREPQGPEIGIESERGHIIEERGYNYKRDRVTEREFMVAAVAAEYMLRFRADAFAVVYDMKIRLYFSKKRERFTVASPVTKQRQCFTDDIPGNIETRARPSGIFAEIPGMFVVDVVLVEAGVEK